jgi:hypothetical protein
MDRHFRTVALAAASLRLLLSLVLALRPDNDEEASVTTTAATTAPATLPQPMVEERAALEIEIQEGAPAGGVQRATVKRGAKVLITIVSDTVGVLHIHGYDITSPMGSTGPQEVAFAAEETGVFEIELEGTNTLLGELTVQP